MKITVFLILALLLIDPGKIGKINALKSEAKEAFKAGDFKTAIAKYRYLIDSLGVNEEEVTMNLANAYFKANDTLNAFRSYQPLTASRDNHIKSLANQQLGVLSNRQGKSEEALDFFKQSMRAAPENDDARFNYETVKKKMQRQIDEDQKKKKDDKDKNNKKEEPSAFAKQLKAKADALVAQKLYRQANELMTEGLKKDKTVSTYQEFIKRTGEVAGIQK